MSKVHHLKADNIQIAVELSKPKLTEIVNKIQLTDKVSEAERNQMLRWVKERLEELRASIEDINEIIDIVKNELSEVLSNDALQFLIDLLSNL